MELSHELIKAKLQFHLLTPPPQQPSIRREVTRYMESGHWFMSLYNDDGDAQEVTFFAIVAEEMTQNCPNGCSGNGQCLLGHCQCNPGFGGDDCSESKRLDRGHFV